MANQAEISGNNNILIQDVTGSPITIINNFLESVPCESIDLSEYINDLSGLRKENKHESVLKLLQDLKNKKWNLLSKELKYRVTLNLAVTYFELDMNIEGGKHFIELLDFDIKSGESFGFAAIGFAIIGDYDNGMKYANKALQINNQNENAYLALLYSKVDTFDIAVIDNLVPIDMQSRPVIAITIGVLKERNKDYSGAFEIFKKLENEHKSFDSIKCDIFILLALNRFNSVKQKDNHTYGQISSEDESKLKYAVEKLSLAWAYLKDTDLRTSKWYVLANRGVVHEILGQAAEAEADYRQSLELRKKYFTFKHLMQLISDDAKKLTLVLDEAKNLVLDKEQQQEITLFRAHLHFIKGEKFKCLTLLQTELGLIAQDSLSRNYYFKVIQTCFALEDVNQAEIYINRFIELYPKDVLGHFFLSTILLNKNDVEKAKSTLQLASDLIDNNTPKSVILDIGQAYFNLNEFKSAAEHFEKVVNVSIFSNLTNNLLLAYYKSGNYHKVFTIANDLLLKHPKDYRLTDLLSAMYEATEMFEESIEILERYLEDDCDNEYILFKLAVNYYKKSDYQNGVKALEKIKNYQKMNLEERFMIADIFIKAEQYQKGLELAYIIIRENPSDQNVHTRFVQLQTQINGLNREDYYPSIISNDCYVELESEDGKKLEYIIVDNPKFDKETSIANKVGSSLIGKAINDTIKIGDESYKIKYISWKYAYVFNNSLIQFSTVFDEGPIKVLKIKPEDTKKWLDDLFLLSDVESNIKQEREMDELYKNGSSTIGINSGISNISPIKYWAKLVTSDIGVYSVGTRVEVQTGLKTLATDIEIVVDITVLLALYHLDAMHLLKLIKHKIWVTNSTVEIIKDEIAEIEVRKDINQLVISPVGTQFFPHVVTAESKQVQLKKLNIFLAQTLENANTISPFFSDDFANQRKLDEVFGKSFNDTRIVASENKYLLFSDDICFRQYCFEESQINGVSTLAFIGFLFDKKLIPKHEYYSYIQTLIKLHFRNVPVNEEILINICVSDNFSMSSMFINACDTIDVIFMNDFYSVRIAVNFIYELNKYVAMSTSKDLITQFVFSKLFMGRNAQLIKALLIPYIDYKFRLLQPQKDQLLQILSSFY